MNRRPSHTGSIMLLVLVFGSIFFIILGALVQLVLTENRAQDALIGKAQSFTIAEAGLEYYAWFLSRFPGDFTHGTGNSGPYVINYADPEGATIGTQTLSVEGSSACGSTQTVDITSTGTTTAYPNTSTTLSATYGSPTVATYLQVVNDGTSPVTFSALEPDFVAMEAAAISDGIFIERHQLPQEPHLGYHLVFNADRTVTITKVSNVKTLGSVQKADTKKYSIDYTLILEEEAYQTLPVPSNCGLVFVEDNIWIEGTISGKITIVAASGTGGGSAPDIILRGNLTYANTDGSDGATIIAERNIMIAPDSPTNMTLHGIFVAYAGYFGRNNYAFAAGGCTGTYEPRNSLFVRGTVVSKYAPITAWPTPCPSGEHAGYQSYAATIDSANAKSPPPFTPTTSAFKQFMNWQQIR